MNDRDAMNDLDVSPLVENVMALPPNERSVILAELGDMIAFIKAREKRSFEEAAQHLREIFRDPKAEEDSKPDGEVPAHHAPPASSSREGGDEPCP